MDQEPAEITFAAGVIAKAPTGRILMVKRTDDGSWAFPGGKVKDGETAEEAAYREFWEECQYRLGSVGTQVMRRVKNDGDGVVDFTTFLCPVESEFVPRLNHEHSSFGWSDPEIALAENRADSMAVAGSQGAELERTLDAGLLADEVERRANVEGEDPGEDLDEATLALILQELEALEERL